MGFGLPVLAVTYLKHSIGLRVAKKKGQKTGTARRLRPKTMASTRKISRRASLRRHARQGELVNAGVVGPSEGLCLEGAAFFAPHPRQTLVPYLLTGVALAPILRTTTGKSFVGEKDRTKKNSKGPYQKGDSVLAVGPHLWAH